MFQKGGSSPIELPVSVVTTQDVIVEEDETLFLSVDGITGPANPDNTQTTIIIINDDSKFLYQS